ncbi:4605_t:CDS:1, partial [Gigaspora margarita]
KKAPTQLYYFFEFDTNNYNGTYVWVWLKTQITNKNFLEDPSEIDIDDTNNVLVISG